MLISQRATTSCPPRRHAGRARARGRSAADGTMRPLPLLPLVAGLCLLSAGGATLPCEYWLTEESDNGDYSKLDVRELGFQTNRSVCTNADDAGAGKAITLQQYIQLGRAQLTKLMRERLLPKVRGGAATTDIVILDIESPKGVHPRGYGELNNTLLAAVVKATRLRLQVARSLMPHAGLALYATALNTTPKAIQAYRRARDLGLWDEVTHLVPVLYTGPGMRGEGLNESVHSRLNASLEIFPRDGSELPML